MLTDRTRLRRELSARFDPDPSTNELIEAERIAGEVVADAWGEIAGDCERALADVHELYRIHAAFVVDAQADLRVRGSQSWIAKALMYRHAFDLAWDVLDEKGLLTELSD